jgi:peptide/nickel transport system substrate-binding protein
MWPARRRTQVAALLACSLLTGCRAKPSKDHVVVVQAVMPSSLRPEAHLDEYSISVLSNVYEPLVEVSRGLAVEPGLAESWESPDELTWVFRLRAGVRLHDGRELDAALAAGALRRIARDAGPGYTADFGALVSIDAPDSRTLVIRTSTPVTPARGLGGVALAFDSARPDEPPVGTGPFRIASWEPGRFVRLEGFEGYRGGRPAVGSLEFRAIEDAATRARAVESGEAQLALDVAEDSLARLSASPGLEILRRPGLRIVALGMRCTPAVDGANPFVDARLRRAVAQAIDRRRLVRESLGGLGSPADQVIPPGIFGYQPSAGAPAADVEAARRGVRAAALPASLSLRLDYPAHRYRAIEKVAAAVAEDLRAVGLAVTPRPIPSDRFLAGPDPGTHLWLLGWMSTRDAGLTYDHLVHTPAERLGRFNWMGYSSPEVDGALDAFRMHPDPNDGSPGLARVARRLAEDFPMIGLYQTVDVHAKAAALAYEPRMDRRVLGVDMAWK